MLRSYSAQLKGSQLTWLETPPLHAHNTRVLVVVEGDDLTASQPEPTYDLHDLAGRLQWRGDAVRGQRAQRDAW